MSCTVTLHIKTTNDVNGNPRRLLLEITGGQDWVQVKRCTEEDYSTRVPFAVVTINVTPTEYKRILKAGRQRLVP